MVAVTYEFAQLASEPVVTSYRVTVSSEPQAIGQLLPQVLAKYLANVADETAAALPRQPRAKAG